MKVIWTKADSLAARREGWDIWDIRDVPDILDGAEPDDVYMLQKLDDPQWWTDLDYDNPVFEDDADAWVWVY